MRLNLNFWPLTLNTPFPLSSFSPSFLCLSKRLPYLSICLSQKVWNHLYCFSFSTGHFQSIIKFCHFYFQNTDQTLSLIYVSNTTIFSPSHHYILARFLQYLPYSFSLLHPSSLTKPLICQNTGHVTPLLKLSMASYHTLNNLACKALCDLFHAPLMASSYKSLSPSTSVMLISPFLS